MADIFNSCTTKRGCDTSCGDTTREEQEEDERLNEEATAALRETFRFHDLVRLFTFLTVTSIISHVEVVNVLLELYTYSNLETETSPLAPPPKRTPHPDELAYVMEIADSPSQLKDTTKCIASRSPKFSCAVALFYAGYV